MLVLASKSSLIDRCVAGEAAAWRELHRQYQPIATSFLLHLGVAPCDVQDAVQEVFVQVFRYLARFERRSDLKTWIYKLCLSHAGRRRKWSRVAGALNRLLGQTSPPTTSGPGWSEGDACRRVQWALDHMKPIHREVFVLYELEGLPGDEIGRLLAIPFSTVRRRLHDARQKFEELIMDGEHPP